MTWKTWLLLFVALIAGTAASYAVKSAFFVEKVDQVADESTVDGPKERLLVANGYLPSGTELNAENVRLELTPEKDVPRDGIFSFSEFAGRKTTRDYKDGEPISLYDVETTEEEQSEELAFVPPGYSVVPIEICSATKTNGSRNYLKTQKLENIVKPGDTFDLVVVKENLPSSTDNDGTVPRRRRLVKTTLVEDITVFSIDDTSRLGADGVVRSSILSALLKAEDLELVRKASEEGKIKVVLNGDEESDGEIDFTGPDALNSLEPRDSGFTIPAQGDSLVFEDQSKNEKQASNPLEISADQVGANKDFVIPDLNELPDDPSEIEPAVVDAKNSVGAQLERVSAPIEDSKERLGESDTPRRTISDFDERVDESSDDLDSVDLPAAENAESELGTDVSASSLFRERPSASESERGVSDSSEKVAVALDEADEEENDSSLRRHGTIKLRSPFVTRSSTTPRKSRP